MNLFKTLLRADWLLRRECVAVTPEAGVSRLDKSIKICCPVIKLVVITRLFGSPVYELGAVIELADGIYHHLAARNRADTGDAGAGQERFSPSDPAPHVNAAKMWVSFRGIKLTPYDRMKAVGGDGN